MALYFYCPGDVQGSATSVTCSVPLQSYTPPDLFGSFVADVTTTYGPFVFMFIGTLFAYRAIKRAIEQ